MIITNRNFEKNKLRWSFEEAREYVRKLGLKNKREWVAYSRSGKRPDFIPSTPNSTYKDAWKGYPDWMGYSFDTHFNKKYSVNEEFFNKWTHDMAYVFGFWFADGYIYNGLKRGKRTKYVLGISQCDKKILEDIQKVMCSTYPIHEEIIKSGISYRFLIESELLVNSIIRLGGSYRKSRTCLFPNIPREYLHDFVRGYFDGDGSVSICKDGRKVGSFTSGSEEFIYTLLNILRKEIVGFKARIVKDKRGKGAFYLTFDVNDAIRLREFMYKNEGMSLQRKKEILNSFGEIALAPKDVAKNFLAFEEARAIIKKEKLEGEIQWREFCSSGRRPANIPSNPNKTYAECGWRGMKNFLGKE